MHYLDKRDLVAELRKCDGRPTDKLVEYVYLLAQRIWHGKFNQLDIDDYKQDCVMVVCKFLHKIDPDKDPFSYITSICMNCGYKTHRQKQSYRAKLEDLERGNIPERTYPGIPTRRAVYEYKGKFYRVSELAKLSKISVQRMSGRIRAGWTVERAVTSRKCTKGKRLEYKGSKYSVAELAKMAGASYNCIAGRLNKGWSVVRAVETKVRPRAKNTQRD